MYFLFAVGPTPLLLVRLICRFFVSSCSEPKQSMGRVLDVLLCNINRVQEQNRLGTISDLQSNVLKIVALSVRFSGLAEKKYCDQSKRDFEKNIFAHPKQFFLR